MQLLGAQREPMSLVEFVSDLREGCLSPKAVAVTFDDGYVDNLRIAKPVLADLGIPATVFVATGHIGKQNFWWDSLQRIVWTSSLSSQEIEIELQGTPCRLRLFEDHADRRSQALPRLWGLVRDLSPEIREAAMLQLKGALNAAEHLSPFRPLSAEEFRELCGGPISIGAHSVTHPWWPSLSADQRRQELHDSLCTCTEVAGVVPAVFSYPYGAIVEDFRADLVNAGVMAACTVHEAPVDASCDPYLLPRYGAPDDMQAFKRIVRLNGT